MLVNIRSSVDVLFCSANEQIGLLPTILKSIDAPLYGFSNHSIQHNGEVKLLVTLSCHLAQATILTNFLIVDTPGVYNAIIRRPALNALRAVTSTYHLVLKFSTLAGVEVAHEN